MEGNRKNYNRDVKGETHEVEPGKPKDLRGVQAFWAGFFCYARFFRRILRSLFDQEITSRLLVQSPSKRQRRAVFGIHIPPTSEAQSQTFCMDEELTPEDCSALTKALSKPNQAAQIIQGDFTDLSGKAAAKRDQSQLRSRNYQETRRKEAGSNRPLPRRESRTTVLRRWLCSIYWCIWEQSVGPDSSALEGLAMFSTQSPSHSDHSRFSLRAEIRRRLSCGPSASISCRRRRIAHPIAFRGALFPLCPWNLVKKAM